MSFVAKIIAKRILGERLENKFGKEDPYFEQVPATRLDGKPSKKTKKRRKALPPGISEHDGQVLTKVKRRAYRLDMALFSFLGVRFGWGSAIGLIPAFGDALDALMALMVMKTCMQIEGGLPASIRVKMMLNIIFDFVIGLVPFAGDLIDAVFRANTRNAILLEEHLREKGKKNLRQSSLPVPAVDPSSAIEFDRLEDHEEGVEHTSQSRPQQSTPSQPEPARVKESRSYFGRSKNRPNDVEMGQVNNDSRTPSKKSRNERR